MPCGRALIFLLLQLSLVSPAPLQAVRPDRPPLIWKWLSDVFGADKDVERMDKAENATYVEELAEAGFNMTGVYISPDSPLNPLKWLQLLHRVIPGADEVRGGDMIKYLEIYI